MSTKKFSYKLKKSYRLMVMMMITASLLGVSYGYWSDVSVIKAEIGIPKLKFGHQNGNTHMRMSLADTSEMLSVDLNGEPQTIINLSVDLTNEVGGGSDIPLKFDDKEFEIYALKDGYEYAGDGQLLPKEIAKVDVDEQGEGKYNFIIELDNSSLETNLNSIGATSIKIKMNFKQKDVPDDEGGWEYAYEKIYRVNFIEPVELMVDPLSGGELGLGTKESSSGTEGGNSGTEESSSGTEESSSGTEESSSETEESSSGTEESSSGTEESSSETEESSSPTEESDASETEDNGSDVGGSSET